MHINFDLSQNLSSGASPWGSQLAGILPAPGDMYQDWVDRPASIEQLSSLLKLLNDNKITNANAKTIFNMMVKTDDSPLEIIEREGFVLNQDIAGLESMITLVLHSHAHEVVRFNNGERKLMGFFMGKVMKESKGKADPSDISKIIEKLLKK